MPSSQGGHYFSASRTWNSLVSPIYSSATTLVYGFLVRSTYLTVLSTSGYHPAASIESMLASFETLSTINLEMRGNLALIPKEMALYQVGKMPLKVSCSPRLSLPYTTVGTKMSMSSRPRSSFSSSTLNSRPCFACERLFSVSGQVTSLEQWNITRLASIIKLPKNYAMQYHMLYTVKSRSPYSRKLGQ